MTALIKHLLHNIQSVLNMYGVLHITLCLTLNAISLHAFYERESVCTHRCIRKPGETSGGEHQDWEPQSWLSHLGVKF